MMKKHLLVLLLAFLPVVASAAPVLVKINGIYYYIQETEAWVTKNGGGFYTGTINIPSSVTYKGTTYKVTFIDSSAFNGCTGLTSVTIPNSVTYIDGGAFYGCTGLTSVAIPNSVTYIGEGAFSDCRGLTSVTIGNGVKFIGWFAFSGCTSLTAVHISDLAAWCKIGFEDDEDLGGYGGSNPLQYAHHLYLNGTEVKDLVIPNGVTSIGDYAFYNCTGLTSVTIPNSVTSIGSEAFYGCSGLSAVHISDIAAWCNISFWPSEFGGTGESNPLSYAHHLYLNGTEVKDLAIPNGVTSIGKYAFYECSSLTSVSIPNSVNSIGNSAFYGSSGLTAVHISDLAAWCSITFGDNPLDYAHHLYLNGKEVKNLVIPNGVTSISSTAFHGCSSITSITIPSSVTSIGSNAFYGTGWINNQADGILYLNNWLLGYKGDKPRGAMNIIEGTRGIAGSAFYNCNNLTSVTIPNSVTSIGQYAFYGCSALTSVSVPNDVTSIGVYTFYGCSGLTLLNIGRSVASIDNYAFYNCRKLLDVYCYAESVPATGRDVFLKNDIQSTILHVPESAVQRYWQNTPWRDFKTILAIENIEDPIIEEDENHITFTDSKVRALCVANWDADGNGSLSYEEAAAITDLGEVFTDNADITSFDELQYFTGLTAIGDNAFYNCTGLSSIIIPEGVTTIGRSAFNECKSLISVTIPESVTSIGKYAFARCRALTTVTIPNGVTSIVEGTFKTCSGLTSVNIPESVTSIGKYAFYKCSSLTSVAIPYGVTYIGDEAFDNCSSLTLVTVNKTKPVTITQNTFSNRANATLYVPKGSRPAYKNADYWKEFMDILEMGIVMEDHIIFADNNVRMLCVANWDTDENGMLSYEEAAVVTDLGEVFGDNTEITSFDELQYFTGLTAISDNAFMGCSKLASVTLPENITSIGAYAFYGCSALTSFTIPQDVNEIGSYAFRNCTGLTDVFCLPLDVPTTASNAFNNSNIGNATLHVVETSYNAYKNAVPWKNFKNMVGDIPVPCATPVINYVQGKLVFTCETEGVEYKSNISSVDMGSHDGSEIELCVAYNVSVYAMKDGFRPSKTATATLCWIDAEPVDGVATGTMEFPAVPVLVKSRNGVITVEGLGNGTQVSVYTTDGALVGQGASVDRVATIHTSLAPGSVAIVKMGEKAVKVVLR